jgi:hypothetical protein
VRLGQASNERVLTLEDDSSIRSILAECLEVERHAVSAVSNGREALDCVRTPFKSDLTSALPHSTRPCAKATRGDRAHDGNQINGEHWRNTYYVAFQYPLTATNLRSAPGGARSRSFRPAGHFGRTPRRGLQRPLQDSAGRNSARARTYCAPWAESVLR